MVLLKFETSITPEQLFELIKQLPPDQLEILIGEALKLKAQYEKNQSQAIDQSSSTPPPDNDDRSPRIQERQSPS